MGHNLVAAFALAGAMALSPVSQALAGETSFTLGNGNTAMLQSGSTKVETDANGDVKVYVSGNGNVTVYTCDGITIRQTVNNATAPKVGDGLVDGTIYAGNDFAATPANAPGLYTWADGKRYCENLEANGHDDWTLPTKDQLNHLYEKRNTGVFAGTFNERAFSTADWYWSFTEHASNSSSAWNQRFTDGDDDWNHKDGIELSVRCVRAVPAAP